MTDDEMIARFIAERGVTRCPTAFAVRCSGTVTEADLAAHAARESASERYGKARKAGLNNLEATAYANGQAHRLSNASRAKLGLPPKRGGRPSIPTRSIQWTDEKIATMKRLSEDGHGFGSMVMQRALGCSGPTILLKAHALGLPVGGVGKRPGHIENSGAGAPRLDGGTASPCPMRDTATTRPEGWVEIAGDVGLARRGHHSGAPTPAAPPIEAIAPWR